MLKVTCEDVYYRNGGFVPVKDGPTTGLPAPEKTRGGTIAHTILKAHNTGGSMEELAIHFGAMASHDITYVGIIQTTRAPSIQAFPLPYAFTNCHNFLCTVGGTINEDDHVFGLSVTKKYGGEFVPAHQSVIHSYIRERYAAPGKMVLGSDSHTRYGIYDTMAVSEGDPELARQLLSKTCNIPYPEVIAIYLIGTPIPGASPQDVVLKLIRSTFKDGVVKNVVMEFFGLGVTNLSMDYRSGIDVMTTRTTCLSSIQSIDHTLKTHLTVLGRGETFKPQTPADGAYYDGLIEVELGKIRPVIALPFHPSDAYAVQESRENLDELPYQVDEDTVRQLRLKNRPASLREKVVDGRFQVNQGIVTSYSGGTYQDIVRTAQILDGHAIDSGEFQLSVYPASQPADLELTRRGYIASLMAAGASIRSCLCGPCLGAGDMPANRAFPIHHSIHNFPSREGSKPSSGQVSYVALVDARSIATTALNDGVLTGADKLPTPPIGPAEEPFAYDGTPYKARVYFGVGRPDPGQELVFDPNIANRPEQVALPESPLLTVCSTICDPVTTTDELIPSDETSSYRSNPAKLSEFALSRKGPQYVPWARGVLAMERLRRTNPGDPRVGGALLNHDPADASPGSLVMALKPGDGSVREQATSYQRVLDGAANLVAEYATKRYRPNVVNWDMLPFITEDMKDWNLQPNNRIYLPGIRAVVDGGAEEVSAVLLRNGTKQPAILKLLGITREERDIVLAGCLIDYYARQGRPAAARP